MKLSNAMKTTLFCIKQVLFFNKNIVIKLWNAEC